MMDKLGNSSAWCCKVRPFVVVWAFDALVLGSLMLQNIIKEDGFVKCCAAVAIAVVGWPSNPLRFQLRCAS